MNALRPILYNSSVCVCVCVGQIQLQLPPPFNARVAENRACHNLAWNVYVNVCRRVCMNELHIIYERTWTTWSRALTTQRTTVHVIVVRRTAGRRLHRVRAISHSMNAFIVFNAILK